ncbi:hypothetical protein [Myroides odoratus]|uniref:hypothetical protein n=1 Tax=Myroides odoratus TaxID=256 RepID=UPI0039B07F55
MPETNIKAYTEGNIYKSAGFLESPWCIFSSKRLIASILPKYDLKHTPVPYVFIKYNNKIVYKELGLSIDKIKEVIKDN